ncbi:MAG: Clostripain precursor [bacterium ADurb.Bin243]|nr:MAG: Clostripain precursor [bacterium ADurb.Bin243]
MKKNEYIKSIIKGKPYCRGSVYFLTAFILLAAALFLCPGGNVLAQDGRNISMSNADYLNMLTNQYVIDYSRAQTLKARVKKSPADKSEEARIRAEEAAEKRRKSLDSLLNAIDGLIAAQAHSDVSVYISSIGENYPAKSTVFKPVFDKLKENLKFKLASSSDASKNDGYNSLLVKITEQEQALKNKKPSADAGSILAQDPQGLQAHGDSTATDFSDGVTASDSGAQVAQGGSEPASSGGDTAAEDKTGAGANEKEWTFMVYMNADNDLESAGIKDINEMEKVGSGPAINIIVQCDRSPEYDESNGNWVGSRRFFIQKDSDFAKINSKEIANLGDSVDMGDPAVLTDFIRWGVKNYPAKKYALVIWNHGSGWKFQNARFSPVKGISYDESSGNHLDNFKLTSALSEGVKINGGRKFDIIIMDACLMAMVEIAYQIKDCAKVYIASEEVAPADGMPYDSIMAGLAANPGAGEKEFSAAIIENYVRSYRGGSQGWSNCTFSAFDLSNIETLAAKIDALSKYLIDNFEQLSYPILLSRLKVLKYSDADYADLYNFCELIQNYSKDPSAAALCGEIMDMVGRPDMRGDYYESFNTPIVITDENEGVIRWTVNDKAVPPAAYIPAGSKISKDGSAVETPLVKNGEGVYSAAIGPFNGEVNISSVQYAIFYKNGRAGSEKIISSANSFFTRPSAKEGAAPVIIAEGHSQSLSLSRGISIYLTPFEDYLLGYKNLDFSKKFAWSSFISHKPVFKSAAKVLVVPDTGYASSDLIYSKFYHHALAQADIDYDLYLPAIYGELEEEVLDRYKDGAVIWYTAKNANCISKYEESILQRFIDAGGRMFINGQNIEQHHGLSKFFTGGLGALYIQDSGSRKIKGAGCFEGLGEFEIGGGEGANNVSDPSIFNLSGEAAKKAFTYAGTEDIAGVKNKNVIFCGFSFESVASAETRSRMIKAVIDELRPAGSVKIDIMNKL